MSANTGQIETIARWLADEAEKVKFGDLQISATLHRGVITRIGFSTTVRTLPHNGRSENEQSNNHR